MDVWLLVREMLCRRCACRFQQVNRYLLCRTMDHLWGICFAIWQSFMGSASMDPGMPNNRIEWTKSNILILCCENNSKKLFNARPIMDLCFSSSLMWQIEYTHTPTPHLVSSNYFTLNKFQTKIKTIPIALNIHFSFSRWKKPICGPEHFAVAACNRRRIE